MYKQVLLAFFTASAAPTQAFADNDVVQIDVPVWSKTFNAYRIECDSPLNPERHHLLIAYDFSTNMDGSSQLEDYLENRAQPAVWFGYNPAETGFEGKE